MSYQPSVVTRTLLAIFIVGTFLVGAAATAPPQTNVTVCFVTSRVRTILTGSFALGVLQELDAGSTYYATHNARLDPFGAALKQRHWPNLRVAAVELNYLGNSSSVFEFVESWIRDGASQRCHLAVGPGYSDRAQAVSAVIGRPLWIDPTASSTQLSNKVFYPNFLRTIPNDAQGGTAMAAFLDLLGYRAIFVIKLDTTYGETLTASLVTEHTRRGGHVVRTFNILTADATTANVTAILATILAQRAASRVVAIIGVLTATVADAYAAAAAAGKITLLFGEYCSGQTAWQRIDGAFCLGIDTNATRLAAFQQLYTNNDTDPAPADQTRTDASFNATVAAMVGMGFDPAAVRAERNDIAAYGALSVDAVWFGLALLQKYRDANAGLLPPTSVAAARFAMQLGGFTFPDGLTGAVGVSTIGDRTGFAMAVYNARPDAPRQTPVRVASHASTAPASPASGAVTLLPSAQGDHMAVFAPLRMLGVEVPLPSGTGPLPFSALQAAVPPDRDAPPPVPALQLTWYGVLLIVVLGALLVALAVAGLVVLCRRIARQAPHAHAPKDENEPVTILFTDIQSSTALWAACPQAMVGALDLHNAIVRRAVHEHHGYEVKTIGDSFMVAFRCPVNAAACALAIQQALHEAPWGDGGVDGAAAINDYYEAAAMAASLAEGSRTKTSADAFNGLRVRIGIHIGYVTIRRIARDASGAAIDLDVGRGDASVAAEHVAFDYLGTTVNTAARIEASAHGGQVVLSQHVLEAMDRAVGPTGTGITDHLSLPPPAPPGELSGEDPTSASSPGPSTGGAFAGIVPGALQALRVAAWLPLGCAALRGLSADVELLQVQGEQVPRRAFPPLRLDKANHITVAGTSSTSSGSASSAVPSSSSRRLHASAGDISPAPDAASASSAEAAERKSPKQHGGPTPDGTSVRSRGSNDAVPAVPAPIAAVLSAVATRRRLDAAQLQHAFFALDSVLGVLRPAQQRLVLNTVLDGWRIDAARDTRDMEDAFFVADPTRERDAPSIIEAWAPLTRRASGREELGRARSTSQSPIPPAAAPMSTAPPKQFLSVNPLPVTRLGPPSPAAIAAVAHHRTLVAILCKALPSAALRRADALGLAPAADIHARGSIIPQ